MRHLRVSCLCFCWMPTVTSPKLRGQSRSVSAAAKKTTFNGQCLGELLRDHHLRATNTYFPVGATFFGPFSNTQIDFACLPATVHVHRCCALHHDGDRLQLAAEKEEGIIVPFSVPFNISLHMEYMKEGKSINGTRTSLHRVPFSRRTEPPFRHEWRKHAGTMKSGTIWRLKIFGRKSIKCS